MSLTGDLKSVTKRISFFQVPDDIKPELYLGAS